MFASGTWNLIPQWSTLLTFLPWVPWCEELHTLPSPLIQTPSVLVEPADLNTFRAEAVSRLTGEVCFWWPITRGEYSSLVWRLGYYLLSDGRHMWSYFKCLWRVKTPPKLKFNTFKIDPLFERSELYETIILSIHVSFGGVYFLLEFHISAGCFERLRWGGSSLCVDLHNIQRASAWWRHWTVFTRHRYHTKDWRGMEVWRMMFLFMLEWFLRIYIYIYTYWYIFVDLYADGVLSIAMLVCQRLQG